ncbi:MAG TPA: vWA domain-containing protein [Methylophilaceae bacterium]
MRNTYPALFKNGFMLFLALIALLIASTSPKIQLARDIRNYLFVVDITQSMNVPDMLLNGGKITRLAYARHLLSETVKGLPCGTKVSVGLFADSSVVALYNPIEVCGNFDIIQNTLAHLEWRMAWHGGSRLRLGLQSVSSLLLTLKDPAQVVFLTDGDEAPSMNAIRKTDLTTLQNSSGWLLVGLGANVPSPIPKLDANNQVIGYWSQYATKMDAVSAESRGTRDDSIADSPSEYYLSALDQSYLMEMAKDLGAHYVRAGDAEHLLTALDTLPPAGHDKTKVNIAWLFALLAGCLVLGDHRIGRHLIRRSNALHHEIAR